MDTKKLMFSNVTASYFTRSVEETINNHILYLSEPMPNDGIYEFALAVFTKYLIISIPN